MKPKLSTSTDPRGEILHPGELAARIAAREAWIGVVGLGSVGLPLSRALLDAGHRVVGIDTDPERNRSLLAGITPVAHLGPRFARELIEHERFELCETRLLDVALIAVPTPLDARGQPDLGCVRAAARAMARRVRPGGLIVLESTSHPGTTRQIVGEELRACGRVPGGDVWLAASPEREDPGRQNARTATIPKLVGGTCESSAQLAEALYTSFVETVHLVESAEVAEAAKLFENVFRAVNIALVNELSEVLRAQGLDPHRVLAAAATKPFGFMPFQPGPGTGGQCIPVDPCYYTHAARAAGVPAELVERAIAINRARPQLVVERLAAWLDTALDTAPVTAHGVQHAGTNTETTAGTSPLAGRRIGVLGVAYKPEVDGISESPGVEILRQLRARGATVHYSDPWVHELPELELESVPVTQPCDAWILVTEHSGFDYAALARSGVRLFDTRGAFARRGFRSPLIQGL